MVCDANQRIRLLAVHAPHGFQLEQFGPPDHLFSDSRMSEIGLGYGTTSIRFAFDNSRYSILAPDSDTETPLSDGAIGNALDTPIDCPSLDEILSADDSVLIVVSDATRATGSARVVNLLVRRLIQYGVSPANQAIIFATGIHRPVTPAEKIELLGPFIAQRIRTLDHNAYDAEALTHIGTTERGLSVEVNRALREFSRVIIVGGVGFHYFAGFTGGRKSICPGLASAATIEATPQVRTGFSIWWTKSGRRNGFVGWKRCA